jgi:hypothetical protein
MVFNNIINFLIPPRFKRRRREDEDEDGTDVAAEPEGQRRRRCCTCRQFRLSSTADANIIADWAFYETMVRNNPQVSTGLVTTEFVLVVLATILYVMQVTEGRLFRKVVRQVSGIELTKARILDSALWMEDFPQLVVSVWVGFSTGNILQPPVLANIVTSAVAAREKVTALWTNDIDEIVVEDDILTGGADNVTTTTGEKQTLLPK